MTEGQVGAEEVKVEVTSTDSPGEDGSNIDEKIQKLDQDIMKALNFGEYEG